MHVSGLLALQMLASVHVHIANPDDVEEACKTFGEIPLQGTIIDMAFEWPVLNCKTNANKIAVWPPSKTKDQVKVRACPGVSKIWMFAENGGQFIKTTPGGEIVTCRRSNDTVILGKWANEEHEETISFQPGRHFKLLVVFEGTYANGKQLTIKQFTLGDRHTDNLSRRRRNTPETATGCVTDVKTNPVSEFSLKDCENNRSCIRFGEDNCDHMQCDYFLSYYVVNKEYIDLELSAKTDGWVAVGFSSDAKMETRCRHIGYSFRKAARDLYMHFPTDRTAHTTAFDEPVVDHWLERKIAQQKTSTEEGGGDDVIACKRKHTSSNEIIPQPLWNSMVWSQPKLKESKLNLTSCQSADGYIYCRMTRPLDVQLEDNLDLTNDWFQLYATGPVEATGQMLKHVKMPKTSATKLTVLRHENILSAVSGGRRLTIHVLCLLVAVISPRVS